MKRKINCYKNDNFLETTETTKNYNFTRIQNVKCFKRRKALIEREVREEKKNTNTVPFGAYEYIG